MSVSDSEIFVVVIVDLDHGRVNAGSEALDLADGEELVVGHLAGSNSKVLLARSHDLVTATQPAGCCCTNLAKKVEILLHAKLSTWTWYFPTGLRMNIV